ncbi:uncharacterized protein LOC126555161 [Aphis gossypii]|uniref:uncharacterized protein LOC126555161 n=1 Tax=Aphis gossypii TaxID=80765 RepID=UPI002159ABA9|nr:uncharacterized protein LOC126555161 [Aphis gossypii]
MSNRKCCVVNCSNTYKNTSNVKFFRFPNRSYEKELKNKWIQAINRLDDNGKLWQPINSSLICGDHFVNNKPSKHPQSPAYIPSIFPKAYKKKTQNNKQSEARYKRALNRQDKTNKLYQDELFEDLNELSENVLHNTNLTSDVSTQVAFDITDSSIFNFECSFDNNNAMTQISGPSLVKVCNIHKVDQSCGPDYPLFDRYFHGFISIKNQQQLKDLTVRETLPEAFKKNYQNCRCIIDCTEIKTEQPNSVEQRVYMYSRYKSSYTVKVLVAVTPNGMICFLSKCYGGRASDSFITNDSGFLNKLEPGDVVLADKGFPSIKTHCETNSNSILVMPPVLHNGRFTEHEVIENILWLVLEFT